MKAITDEETSQNNKFFGSLQNTSKLFEHLLDIIKEKIIVDIDEHLIQDLLLVNDMDFKLRRQQPKKIASNKQFENLLKSYVNMFQKDNKHLGQIIDNIPCEENKQLQQIASSFNIHQMNQVQIISCFVMGSLFQQQKMFQQFETGVGKTTLSLIFMIYVQQKHNINCLSIYQSEELCYRDFNRMQVICHDRDINCAYVQSEEQINQVFKADIIFITNSIFQQIAAQEDTIDALQSFLFVVDEFDSMLFEQNITVDKLSLYTISKYFIGFTGSHLNKVHKKVLNSLFQAIYVQYPRAENIDGRQNHCQETKIFNNRQDQIPYIIDLCQKQSFLTPILLLLDPSASKTFIKSCNKSLLIKDLSTMNAVDIEAFLKTSFLTKQNDKYYTCFINNKQGRGLDIPSNQLIEQNGGITVIIAQFPLNQREFDQFKGRTKRMCNKGQYFVLLWDQDRNNNQQQLEEKLNASSANEMLLLNALLLEINHNKVEKIQKKIIAEEEKKKQVNNKDFKIGKSQKAEPAKQENKNVNSCESTKSQTLIPQTMQDFKQKQQKIEEISNLHEKELSRISLIDQNPNILIKRATAIDSQMKKLEISQKEQIKASGKRNNNNWTQDGMVSNKRQKLE